MTHAIYPGTFDPITHGHTDLICRAAKMFDKVYVAVAESSGKNPMFTIEERVGFIKYLFEGFNAVEVISYSDLTIDVAKRLGCHVMIRGMRAVTDFEYEFRLTHVNRHFAPQLETVFLTAKPEHTFVSSSMVREIARYGGDASAFVSPIVDQALRNKAAK